MARNGRREYASGIAVDESESDAVALVRRFISLMNEGDHERLLKLVHPDVEASLKIRPGETIRGVAELESALYSFAAGRSLFEASLSSVKALDRRRVIAQGRLRWMDDDRVLRDDPVIWAIELEDGRLRRSTAARSLAEAEALLAAAPRVTSA